MCLSQDLASIWEVWSTFLKKSMAYISQTSFRYIALGTPFKIYQELLTDCAVESFKAFDELVKQSSASAKENLERLWTAEDDWNAFLQSVSPESSGSKVVGKGDTLNPTALGTRLHDVDANQEVSLKSVLGRGSLTHFVLLRHLA